MRWIAALLLLTSCAATVTEKHRGISYAAANPRLGTYGSPESAASLAKLESVQVNWISIMPFGFHRGTADLQWGGDRIWETDDSVRGAIAQAHARGIKVLLKPHIWGRTELDMSGWSEEQWRDWFDDYGRFAEHYARIAAGTNADAFSIGNEQKVSSLREREWRAIIKRVRAIYKGPLTYGANFDEVFDVPFWDALDWIGLSGYFPLSSEATPSRETLVRAWQPVVQRLHALSRKQRKPVLFTEIGYRSADGAAWRQWEIAHDAKPNLDAQRIAYEAFFEAVWPHPWVLGAYPWKWFSYPDHGNAANNDYDFESKPALDVIRRHYNSAATSASRSSSRR